MDDRHLADIRTPSFHWGLPIQPEGGALVAMMPPPADKPNRDTSLRLDASAGLDKPVVAHAEVTFRGDAALTIRRQLASLSTEQRDRTLRQVFGKRFDYITPTDVLSRFDASKGEETLVLNGTAALDWTDNALELTGVQMGSRSDLSREPAPKRTRPMRCLSQQTTVPRDDHPARGWPCYTLDPPPSIRRSLASRRIVRGASITA